MRGNTCCPLCPCVLHCIINALRYRVYYTLGECSSGVHIKGNKSIRYVQVGKGFWVLGYNKAAHCTLFLVWSLNIRKTERSETFQ